MFKDKCLYIEIECWFLSLELELELGAVKYTLTHHHYGHTTIFTCAVLK